MNTIIAFDTETTGLPNWKEPSEHPDQPHIVQLGARLVDADTRKILSTIDLIVRPDGWEISPEVQAVHGITTEVAAKVGVPEQVALGTFLAMWQVANNRLAFNEQFDARIIRIAMKRYGFSEDDCEIWKVAPKVCAMWEAQRALGGKRPNLTDAHLQLTGQPIANAHSALGDVDACLAVYWAIRDREPAAA